MHCAHEEIERRAFALWEQRGAPLGTPEIDWLRAEEELKASGAAADSQLAALARAIGSVLGSVAALVSD